MSEPTRVPAAAIDRDNPWPGLSSFTEESRTLFFGREHETDELSRLVRRETLTVLFGQSGLGKSSLLQAGLFPLLREHDHLPLYLRLDHDPASPPLAEQVKAALNVAFAGERADAPALGPDESLWEYFHRKDVDIWSVKNRLLTPVLAFDQFEEIFTLGRTSDAARERSRAFLTELADLVENRAPAALQEKFERGTADPTRFNYDKPSCRVILSLREDFLPDLEGLKQQMPALIHNRLRLKRLNGVQALEAVTRPAPHLLGPGVGEKIVEFVSGARGGSTERLAEVDVEPPLLSVICRELNERRRTLGQAQITADLVSGNRREILHDFYERSVADLPEAMRSFIEDHLLTKSGFRDNLALETALEFPGVTRPLLDTLVARRLLRIEDRLGVQRIELTHDVLAEVIRAARDERQQRLALAAAAHRTRRQHWIIGGLAAAVGGLLIGAFFGLRAQRRAENAEREAAAQSSRTDFIFGSRLLEESKTPEGLAYLVRAAKSDPTNNVVGPRLISALVNRSFPAPIGEPLPQSAAIWDLTYTADSRHAIVATTEHDVRYWDLETGRMLSSFAVGNTSTFIALSPDSQRIALGDGDGNINVWELASGRRVLGPLHHDGRFSNTYASSALAFSPDGRWLISGNFDRTAKIWDAATGALKATLPHEVGLYLVDISRDSQLVATGETRGGAKIWRIGDGQLVLDLPKVDGGTRATMLRFSPDATLILVGDDGGAQLYNVSTGTKTGERLVHAGPVYSAQFTHDGKKLVTTSNDGTARMWEVPSGRPLLRPLQHAGPVNRGRLSSDDRYLATDSQDGVARIWDLNTGTLAIEPIRIGDVRRMDLAPNGRELLTGARDGTVRRWGIAPGAAAPMPSHPESRGLAWEWTDPNKPSLMWSVYRDRIQEFDPLTSRNVGAPLHFPVNISGANVASDGRHLRVAVPGAGSELWTLQGTEFVRHPIGRLGATRRAARFSPRSTRFLWIDNTDTLRIWDTDTGAAIGKPIAAANRYVSFSPDDRQVVVSMISGVALILDCSTGSPVTELHPNSLIYGVNFSPDGRLIVTSGIDGIAQVWDAKTHQRAAPPMPHRNPIRDAVFSHDSRRLLTWTALEARVWDVATGRALTDPMVGGNDITSGDFSEDDSRVGTFARTGREVRIWGSNSGQLLSEPFQGGTNGGFGFFAADRFLVISPGTVWPLPPQSGHKPAPAWLLRLATVAAGGEIGSRGNFHEEAFDANAYDDIRRELAALPADAPYAEWGRWFLADRATRPIAPGFKITAAEAEKPTAVAPSLGSPN